MGKTVKEKDEFEEQIKIACSKLKKCSSFVVIATNDRKEKSYLCSILNEKDSEAFTVVRLLAEANSYVWGLIKYLEKEENEKEEPAKGVS